MGSRSTCVEGPKLDSDGRIAQDARCRLCGYNLRSIRLDDCCPECGTPLERAIQTGSVGFCNAEWLEQMARGFGYLWVALLLGFLGLSLVFGPVVAPIPMFGQPGGPPPVVSVTLKLARYGSLIGSVLFGLVGVWRITARDPDRSELRRHLVLIKTARCGAVATALLGPLAWTSTSLIAYGLAFGITFPIAKLLGGLTICALLVRARQVASKIPGIGLSSQNAIVIGGLLAACLTFILDIVSRIRTDDSSPEQGFLLLTLLVFGMFSYPLFGVWALLLSGFYRARYRKAAQETRKHAGSGADGE